MKISYKYINHFIAVFLILQLSFLLNFEANAMFRLPFAFTVGENTCRHLITKIPARTKISFRPYSNTVGKNELEKELQSLRKPLNPTGEPYIEPQSNKVTLYPQWDLAVSERPLSGSSQSVDIVTGTQSIPGVGLMGTLKKKS